MKIFIFATVTKNETAQLLIASNTEKIIGLEGVNEIVNTCALSFLDEFCHPKAAK